MMRLMSSITWLGLARAVIHFASSEPDQMGKISLLVPQGFLVAPVVRDCRQCNTTEPASALTIAGLHIWAVLAPSSAESSRLRPAAVPTY